MPFAEALKKAGLGRRVPVTAESLRPRALATSFTTVINDITEFKAFQHIKSPLATATGPNKMLTLDHSGYVDMVDETWERLDDDTKTDIPLSAFTHYCAVLLHHRYTTVAEEIVAKTGDTQAIQSLVDQQTFIPKAIGVYLNAIGVCKDPNGRSWRPVIPTMQVTVGLTGMMGRVGHLTNHRYSSHLCPGITNLTLLHDIHHTLDGAEAIWDLPNNFRPVVAAHAIFPNSNLLGYRPSTNISVVTAQTYQNLAIHAVWVGDDVAPVYTGGSIGGIPVKKDFMLHVSERLSRSGLGRASLNPTATGSQTQLGRITIAAAPDVGRLTHSDVKSESYCQMITHRAAAVPVLKLRVERPLVPESYCYTFLEDAVPPAWEQNLNVGHNAHDAPLIA